MQLSPWPNRSYLVATVQQLCWIWKVWAYILPDKFHEPPSWKWPFSALQMCTGLKDTWNGKADKAGGGALHSHHHQSRICSPAPGWHRSNNPATSQAWLWSNTAKVCPDLCGPADMKFNGFASNCPSFATLFLSANSFLEQKEERLVDPVWHLLLWYSSYCTSLALPVNFGATQLPNVSQRHALQQGATLDSRDSREEVAGGGV